MTGGRDTGRRDYVRLYLGLCDCAGPQPSTDNPRADEHAADCPYRRAVEPERPERGANG